MAPRERERMKAPKVKRSSGLPRDARRMTLERLQEQERKKREQYDRPETHAVGQVENAAHGGFRAGADTTRQAANRAVQHYRHSKLEKQAMQRAPSNSGVSMPATTVEGPKTKENVRATQGLQHTTMPKSRENLVDPKTRIRATQTQAAKKSASLRAEINRQAQGRQLAADKAQQARFGQNSLSRDFGGTASATPASAVSVKSPPKTKAAMVGKHKNAVADAKSAKTSKDATRAAQRKAAGAAKQRARREATRKAAQTAQKAGKTAAKALKAAIQTLGKAALALGKGLVALLGAGGVAVVAIGLVAVILLVVASPMGFLFSEEQDPDSVNRISQTVREVNAEYVRRVDAIRDGNTWDKLVIEYVGSGGGSNWVDALAVYAVRTSMAQDGMDVVTVDDTRLGLIRTIFWDMNLIEYRTETEEREEPVLDDEGEDTGETSTVTETVLTITLTCRTAQAQAAIYDFDRYQMEMLELLLSDEYRDYFTKYIVGIGPYVGDGTGVVAKGIYTWPSPVSDLVKSPFGYRPGVGVGDNHLGIDISAGLGTPVLAAADGVVQEPNGHWSYGNNVVIAHAEGNVTLYAHMDAVAVAPGQNVTQGQTIGTIGMTGFTYGPHVHFETRAGGQHVDPLLYFDNYTQGW